MALVIILDQRGSSTSPDLIREFRHELNEDFSGALLRPFVRTAGDEMQAIVGDAGALHPITERAVASGSWWLGVGIGSIVRIGDTARESAGTAFNAARAAVEAAKRGRGSTGSVAARGKPEELADALHASLVAFAFILHRRSERQTEVVRAVRAAGTQREAAVELGITPQAVSEALISAGFEPERLLGDMLTHLAGKTTDA